MFLGGGVEVLEDSFLRISFKSPCLYPFSIYSTLSAHQDPALALWVFVLHFVSIGINLRRKQSSRALALLVD